MRDCTRNANDLAASLPAIAQRIKAKSFMIDGEAVVVGPDGLSRFDELRRRDAARTAILYAFDLIEHDGDDLRERPFLRAGLQGLNEGQKVSFDVVSDRRTGKSSADNLRAIR